MERENAIIASLKQTGHRLTPLRCQLIRLFSDTHLPLSITEITQHLNDHDLQPNKTTIYRELDFLTSEAIIHALDLGEGKKRYELFNPANHHHHLICEGCDQIEEIYFDNDLAAHERAIFDDKKFKVTKHMLEFFGLCRACQQKGNV